MKIVNKNCLVKYLRGSGKCALSRSWKGTLKQQNHDKKKRLARGNSSLFNRTSEEERMQNAVKKLCDKRIIV